MPSPALPRRNGTRRVPRPLIPLAAAFATIATAQTGPAAIWTLMPGDSPAIAGLSIVVFTGVLAWLAAAASVARWTRVEAGFVGAVAASLLAPTAIAGGSPLVPILAVAVLLTGARRPGGANDNLPIVTPSIEWRPLDAGLSNRL